MSLTLIFHYAKLKLQRFPPTASCWGSEQGESYKESGLSLLVSAKARGTFPTNLQLFLPKQPSTENRPLCFELAGSANSTAARVGSEKVFEKVSDYYWELAA